MFSPQQLLQKVNTHLENLDFLTARIQLFTLIG